MAKLDFEDSSDSDQHLKALWNASHLLTLGLVNRFFRNYTRYREKSWSYADRAELINLCYELEHKIYAYENLQFAEGKNRNGNREMHISSLVLRQQIFEYFEHLHHQLLYRDPEQIKGIIPHIDQQLQLWDIDESNRPLNSIELLESCQSLSRIEILIQDRLN